MHIKYGNTENTASLQLYASKHIYCIFCISLKNSRKFFLPKSHLKYRGPTRTSDIQVPSAEPTWAAPVQPQVNRKDSEPSRRAFDLEKPKVI